MIDLDSVPNDMTRHAVDRPQGRTIDKGRQPGNGREHACRRLTRGKQLAQPRLDEQAMRRLDRIGEKRRDGEER